jgi:hypothetical protein
MHKIIGIRYTLRGGYGFLNYKEIFDISVDGDSCFMKFDGNEESNEEYDIDTDKTDKIFTTCKRYQFIRKSQKFR